MGKKHRKSLATHRAKPQQQRELSNLVSVVGADALRRETDKLQKEGYFAAPIPEGSRAIVSGNGFPTLQWEDFLRSKLMCKEPGKPSASLNSYPTVHLSSGGEVPCDVCGTKGLGYMAWGAKNNKPNVMTLLREASPYTASAHKFNVDLCCGKGPRALYHYVQYVGGNITEKSIPYAAAGTLIKGWIRHLHRELMKYGDSEDDYVYDLREQIAQLQEDYTIWEQTNMELNNFYSRNNLHLLYLSLSGNMIADGMCFPMITLNKRTVQHIQQEDGSIMTRNLPTSMWTPKITGIRYLENSEARLERMDHNGRINYVYNSKQWLNSIDNVSSTSEDFKITALPALDPHAPLTDLRRIIRETRQANGSIRQRPTQLVLPIKYPSPGHPYYPVLPWQSIFSGDIYEYLMTMISDRNKRRRNSNVIGRILYINNEWLNRLYYQKNANTTEEKKKIFAELRSQINSFLEDRDNMGKPLVAYTFQSQADGKTYESWKIVEIEANDKNSVEANQKELAEISSIVFFAHGLDSRLVGNSPGDVGSSGGTDLRERYLLKQVQMSPTQMLLLAPLYLIKYYNGWDANHLEWEIPREVLTTLDNSKTGITSQPSSPEE